MVNKLFDQDPLLIAHRCGAQRRCQCSCAIFQDELTNQEQQSLDNYLFHPKPLNLQQLIY